MNTQQSIIAIRRVDVNAADRLFADLMNKTEKILNQQASIHVQKYRNLTPSALERVSHQTIQLACQNTPFDPDNVILVSGHKFPDIVADEFYGVEVKSTNKDHWTSTGSSIVESTRIDSVDNIYMLFGKLGGNPPEFRCRPYQDVMRDIAVTHSPRYLIDMTLEKGETIFDKLDCPYDELRTSPDAIEKVRRYYKQQAKANRNQMPWWIDDSGSEPIKMNIQLWNKYSIPQSEKLSLGAQMFILFPEMVKGDYGNAAMWLAGAKGIVNPHFRDYFSAGGKIKVIAGKEYKKGLKKNWKSLAIHYRLIKDYLKDLSFLQQYLEEFNPELLESSNKFECWYGQIEKYWPVVVIDETEYKLIDVLEKQLI